MASVGQDLAIIRKQKGLSLEEIHQATKIPMRTLLRIEANSIFDETEENPTYVRSFIRSYAKALQIPETQIVDALDQHQAGNYNHLLLDDDPELLEQLEKKKSSGQPEEPEEAPKIIPESNTRNITAQGKEKDQKVTPPPPTVSSVNWVEMGNRFSMMKKGNSLWIVLAIVVLLLVLAGAYFIYQQDFFSFSGGEENSQAPSIENIDPGQNQAASGESPELRLELQEEAPEPPPAETADLDETLYLTVYAAYNRLDPIRIWSDLKPQYDPYWLDQGTAYHYEFTDTIRFRGQYTQLLLFMNGHRIDNFRLEHFNNAENAVEITREQFLADPKWSDPIPLELPDDVAEPTVIQNRPTF